MITTLVQALPLVIREYTDRQGQTQIFKSKGFIFDDGQSSIYAEAVQEWAQRHEDYPVPVGSSVIIHPVCRCRSWKDNNNVEHYSNEFTIQNIKKV